MSYIEDALAIIKGKDGEIEMPPFPGRDDEGATKRMKEYWQSRQLHAGASAGLPGSKLAADQDKMLHASTANIEKGAVKELHSEELGSKHSAGGQKPLGRLQDYEAGKGPFKHLRPHLDFKDQSAVQAEKEAGVGAYAVNKSKLDVVLGLMKGGGMFPEPEDVETPKPKKEGFGGGGNLPVPEEADWKNLLPAYHGKKQESGDDGSGAPKPAAKVEKPAADKVPIEAGKPPRPGYKLQTVTVTYPGRKPFVSRRWVKEGQPDKVVHELGAGKVKEAKPKDDLSMHSGGDTTSLPSQPDSAPAKKAKAKPKPDRHVGYANPPAAMQSQLGAAAYDQPMDEGGKLEAERQAAQLKRWGVPHNKKGLKEAAYAEPPADEKEKAKGGYKPVEGAPWHIDPDVNKPWRLAAEGADKGKGPVAVAEGERTPKPVADVEHLADLQDRELGQRLEYYENRYYSAKEAGDEKEKQANLWRLIAAKKQAKARGFDWKPRLKRAAGETGGLGAGYEEYKRVAQGGEPVVPASEPENPGAKEVKPEKPQGKAENPGDQRTPKPAADVEHLASLDDRQLGQRLEYYENRYYSEKEAGKATAAPWKLIQARKEAGKRGLHWKPRKERQPGETGGLNAGYAEYKRGGKPEPAAEPDPAAGKQEWSLPDKAPAQGAALEKPPEGSDYGKYAAEAANVKPGGDAKLAELDDRSLVQRLNFYEDAYYKHKAAGDKEAMRGEVGKIIAAKKEMGKRGVQFKKSADTWWRDDTDLFKACDDAEKEIILEQLLLKACVEEGETIKEPFDIKKPSVTMLKKFLPALAALAGGGGAAGGAAAGAGMGAALKTGLATGAAQGVAQKATGGGGDTLQASDDKSVPGVLLKAMLIIKGVGVGATASLAPPIAKVGQGAGAAPAVGFKANFKAGLGKGLGEGLGQAATSGGQGQSLQASHDTEDLADVEGWVHQQAAKQYPGTGKKTADLLAHSKYAGLVKKAIDLGLIKEIRPPKKDKIGPFDAGSLKPNLDEKSKADLKEWHRNLKKGDEEEGEDADAKTKLLDTVLRGYGTYLASANEAKEANRQLDVAAALQGMYTEPTD